MRFATVAGQVHLVRRETSVDVETLSHGRFPARPRALYDRWTEFTHWAADHLDPAVPDIDGAADGAPEYGPPSPEPRQIFAVGLNYADHAAESGLRASPVLTVFTKFVSSLTGPAAGLRLPSGFVDWEAELVAVIGRTAEHVDAERAWEHVAGLTIGQDYSERRVQLLGEAPQYSLAKSYAGFSPTGPVLVTPDEVGPVDDLEIECFVNGERVQHARTAEMIIPVPELVARISAVCTLYPGDLIFTGTPSGVGFARRPPRYLQPGDTVLTRIQGIGQMTQTCVAGWSERAG